MSIKDNEKTQISSAMQKPINKKAKLPGDDFSPQISLNSENSVQNLQKCMS